MPPQFAQLKQTQYICRNKVNESMTKYKTLEGKEAVVRFIDEHCYICIISITQDEDDFTIFYKE